MSDASFAQLQTLSPQQSANMNRFPISFQPSSSSQDATIGGISIDELITTYGSPLYIVDHATLQAMIEAYQTAFSAYPGKTMVLFASKANMNVGLCQIAAQSGLGLDVVSGGELYTAIKAKFPLTNVLFNGNNKSVHELELALENGIGFISVDNRYELKMLANLATSKKAKVAIFLRITPGIECHTHDYIKTGHLDSKFGFDMSELDEMVALCTEEYSDCIQLVGLHAHIGSQIFETRPYADLVTLLVETYQRLQTSYSCQLTHLNLGGGLGIAYTQTDDPVAVSTYANTILTTLVAECDKVSLSYPTLFLEPGRSLIATAGMTCYQVGPIKTIPQLNKTYVTIDGGMGDNIRPSLYGAQYTALVCNKSHLPHTKPVTLAGRYCESGDILIKDWQAPESIASGDIVGVFATGAYNASMASNYNRVPRPAMVLVKEGQHQLMMRRETWDDVVQCDQPIRL